MMPEGNDNQIRRWVDRWKAAGPVLERIREEDLQGVSTVAAIQAFSGLVFAALKEKPAEPESGLVEQQRIFRKVSE
jgi:hypothetical protein